jgi:hypothetical protein
MSSGDTISWYAYQDPKSGREYFHEPVSGQTTWVLPTSRIRWTDDTTQHSTKKAESLGGKNARQSKPMGRSSHPKSHLMSAVGLAIVSILVFNTSFLLVLVKVFPDNNEVQSHAFNIKLPGDSLLGPIINSYPQSALDAQVPSIKQLYLDNETQCSKPDDAKSFQEIYLLEPASTMKEGIRDASEAKYRAVMSNVESASQSIGRRGKFGRVRADTLEHHAVPTRCWVPFSYILLRMCRQQARDGLPMPLANAENLLLI